MSLKPSIGQIVNPFFLQDGQDVNPSAVSYPLNVADGVKGGSSALDPLSLDIEGLPTGALATTTELAINNGTVNEKTTLSDLATFLDNRDVYSVADITALNAITGMDTGDVAIVADTFDLTGEHVAGSYVYNGTTWLLQSWYNVYLNTLLDVNAPSPVAGDVLQWDGTTWVNVANAFAPLNGTPTEVRYFGNTGVSTSDPLFTRDEVTNHTKAVRDYNSQSIINTVTSPVSFITANTNGTFTIGDQVETQFGEAQAEVLDVGTATTTEPQYTNLAYSGVGLNDLTSIYVGGYSGSYPVSYTVEVLQNNVAYSPTAMLSGTISIGDTITGLTSGATATVVAIDQFKNVLAVDTIVGIFIPSEIVQGNTPSDFISIGGDFSTLADIVLISNTNANSIITTIAPTSQLEGVETSFSSFTGHTIGDTWTFDISPTTTLTIVYLTNITGTLPISSETRLNNLTTPFQTDDGSILASQFSIGDTVQVIDLSAGFTQVGEINITQVSGSVFTYTLNSGTISLGNYLYSGTQGKQGFIYDIDSTTVTTTIRTGFETQEVVFPVIPFPLQGSALTSDNGADKAGIGVFNLTPFGQEDAVPAIIKFYADGSQGTFQVVKGGLNSNGFDAVNNRSFDLVLDPTQIIFNGFDGSNAINFTVTSSQASYRTNGGTQFTFPNTYNGPVSVMTDMSGNGNFTLEPLSSLITPINIYTNNGTLTDGRKVTALGFEMEFIGTNSFNEQWNLGAIDNYDSSGIKTVGFSNGNLGGIKAQSIAYEPSQFVYEQYTGVGDFSNTLPNKSRTIYRHDSNTAVSTVNTRLVESTSSNSVYDETITANGTNITGSKTNTVATNSSQINESYDVLTGEFIRTISNIFDSNTYQQTKTDFTYTSYDNTRDDSGTTTPINFIYTDNSGKFLSAPLSSIINNIYNSDGTLTGTRTLSGNGNQLIFDDLGGFYITNSGEISLGSSADISIYNNGITGNINISPAEDLFLTNIIPGSNPDYLYGPDPINGAVRSYSTSIFSSRAIRTETANFTVLSTDANNIVHIDNSANTVDIQLLDPTTVGVGRPFRFKAVGNSANTVRFLPFASENIDLSVGAYTWSNPLGLQALEVYTDGIEWFIS